MNVELNKKLFLACKEGDADTIKTLLEAGADANARNRKNSTPLHEACIHGDADMVHTLLMAGADVNAKDELGATPLNKAKRLADVRKQQALCKAIRANAEGLTYPEIIRIIKEASARK